MNDTTAVTKPASIDAADKAASDVGILDQFQTELVDAWQRLPNKLFFVVSFTAWAALFQFFGNSSFGWHTQSTSLFVSVYRRFAQSGPDAEQTGLWMPFLVIGLFWWKRKELLAQPLKLWWPGLLMVALAAGLHAVGYLVQQEKLSTFAFFLGLYGLTGLAWGWGWLKTSFFPFFLFLGCIPLGTVADAITNPLKIMISVIVQYVAHDILDIKVLRAGALLFDPSGSYQYEVAAACSGIRSLIAIGTMATAGAFIFFRSWWRRLVVIGLAVPMAVLGNSIRLLLIIFSAAQWGKAAGDYVHEGGPFGIISLLPYIPAMFGLMWIANHLEESKPSERDRA